MTDPTITSRVPQVADWLIAAAQASPLLGGAGVQVIDGPQPPTGATTAESALWIGFDPAITSDTAAEASQSWALLDHGRTRDEDGEITVSCQHWSGDTTVKTHRDKAAAMVGAVELLLRGDGVTGPGDITMGGLVQWSGVDGPFAWYQRQNSQGCFCLVTFRVAFRARLTTGGS